MKEFVDRYLADLGGLLTRLDATRIAQAIEWLRETRDSERTVYICGNGGSASIASQMVVDMVKDGSFGQKARFKMIGLTDSVATITAYGNDEGYESVFIEPLKNFAQPGDLLIAISGGGNSPNVLRAVEYANAIGCRTIGLSTAEGGKLRDLASLGLVVPSRHMGRLEDCFFIMTHILAYAFIEGETTPREPTRVAPSGFTGLVEFRPHFCGRQAISHVLFDFDGTLSLIRQGWPEVMAPMFVEMLPAFPGESAADVERLAMDDIMRLNGKQTIYQMIQLAERIRERGGEAREPLWYKHEYLRRLDLRIRDRVEGLQSGRLRPDDLLVFGSRRLLESLRARGLSLYLASGTDEPFVRNEAELLNVAHYFDGHIHGALDDYQNFSKQMVIQRILCENGVPGEQLLAFGDGYVEIENTKNAGGLAVAVASDEAHNGSGRMDPWKRERLWGVGADVVIPDYRDADALLRCLLGEGAPS